MSMIMKDGASPITDKKNAFFADLQNARPNPELNLLFQQSFNNQRGSIPNLGSVVRTRS